MAGGFELFIDSEARFRFRLTGSGGETVVLSMPFADRKSAVRGIAQVRECAGMGLVVDLTVEPPALRVLSWAAAHPTPGMPLAMLAAVAPEMPPQR
jgi:uncharacterized protein YegP (UPF0339 family)